MTATTVAGASVVVASCESVVVVSALDRSSRPMGGIVSLLLLLPLGLTFTGWAEVNAELMLVYCGGS